MECSERDGDEVGGGTGSEEGLFWKLAGGCGGWVGWVRGLGMGDRFV